MAVYNVAAGDRAAHDKTLVANVADAVNFTADPDFIEVLSDGAAAIYLTIDGSAPAISGPKTIKLPALPCSRKIRHGGNQAVRLISAGTPTYSVTVI